MLSVYIKMQANIPSIKSLTQHTAVPVGAGEIFQVAKDLYYATQILIMNLRSTYTVWMLVMLHTASDFENRGCFLLTWQRERERERGDR